MKSFKIVVFTNLTFANIEIEADDAETALSIAREKNPNACFIDLGWL